MNTTMSFALPTTMRSYIDERVKSGAYGNTSEYLRDLIRRDQEELAKKRLRERGLLNAEADPADRRNLHLSLTAEGQAVQRSLQQQAKRLSASAGCAGSVPPRRTCAGSSG